jgi:hypothetical protein
MFPVWEKKSIETFLSFVENEEKTKTDHNNEKNKEAFHLLALVAKEYLNNKTIQEIGFKEEIKTDTKKVSTIKKRKISY